MKTVQQLEKTLHSRQLQALNLYRFVQQPAFQQAYQVATDEEKECAARLIEELNQARLEFWTKTILRTKHHYELLEVRYLRQMAQERGIRGYSAMTRLELVSRLNGSVVNGDSKVNGIGPEVGDGRTVGQVRRNETDGFRQAVPESA